MKLKKIVSLAAAALMAVSMLAACGDGAGSSSSEVVPPVATTGIADALNDARNDYAKNIMKLSYEESSSLTNILKTAAQDAYGKDVAYIKDNSDYANAEVIPSNKSIYTKVGNQLAGGATTADDMAFTTKGTTKNLVIYTIGGDYAMPAVGNQVANVSGWGTNVLTGSDSTMPLTNNSNLKANYTAEAAAVKITSPDDAAASMWVVAVVYTQTVVDA